MVGVPSRCALLVELQSVHGLQCYDNKCQTQNVSKCFSTRCMPGWQSLSILWDKNQISTTSKCKNTTITKYIVTKKVRCECLVQHPALEVSVILETTWGLSRGWFFGLQCRVQKTVLILLQQIWCSVVCACCTRVSYFIRNITTVTLVILTTHFCTSL